MGCPKLLLPMGATTVIARMLAALKRPGINATIVVIRPDDESLRLAVAQGGAIPLQPAVSPPEMRQSVELALHYIADQYQPRPNDGWLLAPADHPLLDPAIIDQIVAAWRTCTDQIHVPVYCEKRGHPTIFPFRLAPEVFQLSSDQGLNCLLQRPTAQINSIKIDSPAVIADLDTPEDYARLQAEFA